jgi:hypothetical protein
MMRSEQLLQALRQCDDQLERWISKSDENAALFIADPAAALEAAAADNTLNLEVVLELEALLIGLARKLKLPVSALPEINLNQAC